MADDKIKGPLWGALAVVLFVVLLQVIRAVGLSDPTTWIGIVLLSLVQVAGSWAILNFCVKPMAAARFFLVALPFVLFGNTAWRGYLRGLSRDGNEVVLLLTAMAVGVGLGGILATWIWQHRRDTQKESS